MNGGRRSSDRELEDLEVLRQEVTKARADVEFNKTPLKTGLKQRQNGVSISPTVQQNDELAGSFKNSVNRVNGVKGVRHKLDQPLQADEQDDGGPKTRYAGPLQRYLPPTIISNKDNLTEEDIQRLKLARAESAKKPTLSRGSAASSKTQKLWESLDDIDVIRSQEQSTEPEEESGNLPRSKDYLPSKMNSVGVTGKASEQTMEHKKDSVHDLVPAGLQGSTDMSVVEPSYSMVGESLRLNTPNEMQCSMFCGGRKCKYESDSSWKPSETALTGIYSHWITEDLLAMARPNTSQIKQHNLIGQFDRLGIKSIVNLQMPGEHASCGPKLENSGFTYEPNEFMKNKIFFYNFVWKDFSETSMPSLLDMVKVLSFALQEGKVAVHCHAGLGRTGVLLACYLVYYLRVRSNDAIRYVRLKRPNMVQTRRQIQCVKEFETYFLPQCVVYSTKPPNERDKKLGRFPVETCLKRQKYLVHGFEARALKHIPKILYVICERLVRLCDTGSNVYNANECNFTRRFLIFKINNAERRPESSVEKEESPEVSPSSSTNSTQLTRLSDLTPVESGRSERLGELAHKMPDWNSSQSLMSEENSVTNTPGFTRPGSETNSLGQSCSSALSGVDDRRLDELLGDGIKGQLITENKVALELASHMDLQKVAMEERLPIYKADQVASSLVKNHREAGGEKGWQGKLKRYQTDLNYRMSSWDMLATETSLTVLSTLLLDWLEHLKTPLIDKDCVINIVILCEDLEKALKRLNANQAFIIEYLVRLVARLQPLAREKAEEVMKRILASLTHQSIPLGDSIVPPGKNFPRMRPGTFDSCLTLLMSMYDTIVDADNLVKPDSDRRTEDMSLNSSSEFSQRTDRGGMQIGSDPEESEKEVKMNMGQEEKEEEEKGEKVKGSKEKEDSVKENIEKIMEDANGVKDGPIRSSL